MRKFLVTIILLVTMVLSNWAASSYNAMLPSSGRDFWLTYMYNFGQPDNSSALELQLYAIAEDATTVTVTTGRGTVLTSQALVAGQQMVYTIPTDKIAEVYNTGSDETTQRSVHVTSSNANIALYMRNSYASDDDYSCDISPVFQTNALGKEYMIQTYSRDMDRTEMAIVATEDNTEVIIALSKKAQKFNGTDYNATDTIRLTGIKALSAGEVYQLKGSSYNATTKDGTLTGTTVYSTKPIAVFNGGSKASIPFNNRVNGDHLCEQSIPIKSWGKTFVLQEIHGFEEGTVLDPDEGDDSRPTEYYITAIYPNTEISVNGSIATTLEKGESYKISLKFDDAPVVVSSSLPVICYGYTTNGAYNTVAGESFGEPSMILIPSLDKGVNSTSFLVNGTTDDLHFANVAVPTAAKSAMQMNGTNIGAQFTDIPGTDYSYARVALTNGVCTLSNANDKFVAVTYNVLYGKGLEAFATVFNMTSAAPKVYIDNELVDDGTELEWCNNHPGINFRAEIDYPHDSVRWTFGDGQTSTSTTEQHEYHLKVEGEKETNNVCLYVYHHTPLGNEKKIDSVHVKLIVHPTYYFNGSKTEVRNVCGKEGSYTWRGKTYNFDKSTNKIIEDTVNYRTKNYGCDSVYYLKLHVHPEVFGDTAASVCPPDLPYHWRGKTVSTDGGTLVDTLVNQFGCDSIVTLTLHVLQPTSSEFSKTACDSYTWNGVTYTDSGDKIQHFTNAAGCDSTATLHLTILKKSAPTTDTKEACDSYTWEGDTYTTSGNYTKTLTNAVGCDSVVTLKLTILKKSAPTTDTKEACESYTWEGDTYTTSGNYTKTLTNAVGCDSVVTLKLTINKKSAPTTDTKEACESYTWEGDTYTTSGSYTKTLTNAVGCDSVVTLHLTINHSTTGDTTATACDSFTWHGITYIESGNPTYTYHTVHGCDSVVTLHLTINKSYHIDTTAVECESFTWHGTTYTSTPAENPVYSTQTAAGCDSIVTLHLTILTPHTEPTVTKICQGEQYEWNYNPLGKYNGQTFDTDQKLADTISCGEIYTLDLTVLPRPSVTSLSIQGGTNQCFEHNTTLNYQVSSNAATYEYAIYGNGTIIDPDDPSDLPPHPAPHRAGALISKTGTIDGNSIVMNTASLTAGIYEVHFVVKSAANCVSDTAKASFRILAVKDSVKNDTICHEGSLLWFGTHYNTAGTFYHTDKYTNGCDSVHYTLNLTRLNVKEAEKDVKKVCKESLPFEWHGQDYYTSGTYHNTIYYQNGCDSVRFTLDLQVLDIDTIQPPVSAKVCKGDFYTWDGGDIDTDTLAVGTHHFYSPVATAIGECLREVKHLVLTVQAVPTPTEKSESACETYTWNGTTYTESGDYTYTHTVGSCEVTDILHLTIGQPWETTVYKTIHPQKTAFTWDEFKVTFQNVNKPGTYTKDKEYKTVGTKCDSIYHLTLIVTDKIDSTLHHTMCSGDTYSWRGTNYTATGVYTDDTTNPDTTFILDLNVQKRTEKTPVTKHICDATSFTWKLADGTVVGTYNVNGTYEHTQLYTTGCDSVHHTLELSFGTPNTGVDYDSICAGKFYADMTTSAQYGHDFDYTKVLTNVSGCDSVVTVHVHVRRSDKTEFPAEACGQYEWEGQKYTTSGDYQFTYTNNEGCDSVVTMHLTIHNVLNERLDEELEEGEKYEWHRGLNQDTTITTAGTYYDRNTSVYGCDSTYVLHVQYIKAQRDTVTRTACDSYKWGGHTYTESGIYGDTVWSADHKSYTAIHYVKLTINKSDRYGYAAQTICEGDAVEMNGNTYQPTTTGWLRVESSTDEGCLRVDSMYVTVKTVKKEPVKNIAVCETKLPYEWRNITCEDAGTYGDTLRYDNGCDSIIYTLKLTVNTVTPDQEFNETTCKQSTYNWTAANMSINCRDYEPGVYTFYKDTTYAGECDVCHLKLKLTITSSDPIVSRDTTCQGYDYTWYVEPGRTKLIHANQTSTEFDTVHAATCDRIYQLELTVLEHSTHPTEDTTICQKDLPFYWHGQTLTEAGTYKYTSHYPEPYGCDSVYYTLNLKVQTIDTASVSGKVCHGDHYTWIGGEIDSDTLTAGLHTYLYEVPALPGECTSEVKKLSLLVNMPYETDTTAAECDSFTWHGKQYTTTGDYTWEGKSIHGCDSVVTLHLTIGHNFEDRRDTIIKPSQTPFYWEEFDQWFLNHTSGTKTIDKEYTPKVGHCDSIYHLTVTVSDKEIARSSDTICQGQPYTWHEQECTETKVYTFDTPDTLYYLNLLVRNYTTIEETYDLCGESEFQWEKNGKTYTTSGTHTDIAYYTDGCDSVHYTLHLTLGQPTTGTRTDVVCRGDYYEYSNTGEFVQSNFTYVEHQLNKAGCDSAITVNVQVNEPKATTLSAVSLCESELPYIWDEREYRTTGEHQFTYTAANGCDSVVTLPLTVNPTTYIRLPNVEIYEGQSAFTWYRPQKTDTIINTNGTYYDHYTSVHGCDSTYELHVQVGNVHRDTVTRTACDSFEWGGHTYFENGRYGDTIWNGTIYTDIHYVELTINHSAREQHPEQTICEGESITWLGDTYTPTASQWLRKEGTTAEGCQRIDSMYVTVKPVKTIQTDTTICQTELPLIWRGHTLDKDTVLTEKPTCDSIYTIKMKVSKVTPEQHDYMTKCQYSTVKWMGQIIPCQNLEPKTYEIPIDTLLPGECAKTRFVLHLTVTSSDPVVTYDTICYGDSYDWYVEGQLRMANLTSTCIQHDTIHDEDCDRVYRLELEVREPVEPQVDDTVHLCALDEPIQWHGMTLSESGTYTFREEKTAQDGHCDNIYQITVVRTVLEQKDYTDHACLGDDYIWNNRTITADELTLGVNHFYDTVPAVAPATCPTIVNHLALTVTRPYTNTDNVIACEEYTWRGRHYTESTTDTDFVPATETSCDSTFVLNLTIGHNFEKWDATTITKDQLPYTWHHTTFEGAASKDETYHNAATGCDSIWHLTLTVSERIPDTTRITICEGDTYKWPYDNTVYNKTGIFSCTTMDKQPHLLYLTVNPNSDTIIYVEDCIDSYNWHGEEKTVSGEYTWTGVNLVGCDSIETLHLTLINRSAQNESRTVCPGEQVRWGNTNHTAVAGETIDLYRLRKLNATCSVEDTLHLTVRAAVTGEQTESACASFEWHGETYTESGDYTWTGTTTAGCDSVATLHLTINKPFYNEEDVQIHEDALPYYWTGHKSDTAINNNGDYYDRFTTVDGCDSIYHLHLHIGFVTRDTAAVTECDSYEWNGTTYTESKLYTDTVWNEPTHETYDAIHYLDLTINKSVNVEEDARQYCEGESFVWKGQTHNLSVGDTTLVYKTTTAEGCDSITTMHVTILSKYGHAETATVCWTELPYIWRGIACNEAKTYADTVQSMNGCDSILTLTLTVLQPQTQPAEDEQEICLSNTYTWHGMSIHRSEIGTYDYYYRYKNPDDCDSITDHLTLTVKENEVDTIHDISCYGADYTWTVEDNIVLFHGDPTADLWKVDTVHNPLCDHVYVLDLKIMPKTVTVTTDTTICAGSDYLWPINGQSYGKAGLYADTLRSIISGCDSVIRQLDLKVRTLIETPVTLELCEGSNYIFFDEEFTNLQAGTTIEREHVEKYVGCDCDSAITTLSLTVVPTLIDESNSIVTCGEYTWNDVTPARTYTNISNVPNAENLYINDTVITQDGQCATKHILHLTLQPTYVFTVDTIVRSLPVVYKGIRFNSTEDVVTIDTTVTMHASTTCDSIYHITVVKTDKEIKNEMATICEGETFNWRGDTYTTAGSYVNTTAHPDTVFNLQLTVNPMTRHEAENVTTCDETYSWRGHTLNESTICYDTVAGQGDACAEIYTLNLTMIKAKATSEYDTICTNMLPYTWAGRGTYPIVGTDTMLLSEYTLLCGETITDTMRVHVWPTAYHEESMTTCSNEPVIWNGNQYNTTGDYTWTGATIHGCDSVATLHLTVLEAFISDEHLEVAEGPLEWRGQLLTEDGIYTDSLTKVENGCDSIYRVNFHINIAERDTTREQECGSYTWSQTGETYTESTVARDTVWNATHTNYTVYSLELTIWPKYDYIADTDTAAIKSGETYEWYENTYTQSGDYTHMVTTIHGCDSLLASLHLIVGDPIFNNIYEEACENEGYEFKGKIYTETTILYDSLKTEEGLDSIDVIHLTIWPTITHTLDTIVCDNYEWNGMKFNIENTKDTVLEIRFSSETTGCDSIERLVLTLTDSIVLVPGNELIVDKLGYCPGDTAYIPYNLLKGNPTEYKLDFNQEALEQGFIPHGYKPLTGHNDIPIAIPEDCDADTYVAILQLRDNYSVSRQYRFEFTVAYDGVLHTMWNDVLAIDNSKELFLGYRWFRDGIEIPGANKQYYNQDGEPLKGEYRAGLLLQSGLWIYTCPLEVDMTNEPLSLTAMPCPAPKGMPVTLTIHGADLETLENGVLTVYSISGQIVYRRDGAEHQQQVDLTTGQYIGVFRTNDDRSVNVKFLVY